MSEWHETLRSFPCYICGAAPGEHCKTSGGNPKNEPHADRGARADRCPKCRTKLPAEAEPGDICARCAQVRALEIERASYWQRRY